MQNTTRWPRVERYLQELDAALTERAPAERAEIVASVREHIEDALGEDDVSDAEVDRVLGSLGDPLAIAAEATAPEARGAAQATPQPRLSQPWVPLMVILLIMVSGAALLFYLPVVSLIVGLVMLWMSALWTPGEKLVGTLALPAPGVAFIILGLMSWGSSTQVCSSESASVVGSDGGSQNADVVCTGGTSWVASMLGTGALLGTLVAAVVTAFVLYRRGIQRVPSTT